MKVITVTILLVKLLELVHGKIDLSYVDDSIDPCDDFYQFACGNFGKYHTRLENQPLVDLFTLTQDELVEIGIEILSSPKNSQDPVPLKRAKTAYKSCVDVPNLDYLPYYLFPEQNIIKEFREMPLVSNISIDKISFSEIGEIAGKFGINQLFEFVVKNVNLEDFVLILFPDSMEKPKMIRPRSTKSYDEVLEESLKRISKPNARVLQKKDPFDIFLYSTAKHLVSSCNTDKSDQEIEKELSDIKEFMTKLFSGGIIDDDMLALETYYLSLKELQTWTNQQFGNEIDINWVEFFQHNLNKSNINITDDFEVLISDPTKVYGILNLVRKTNPNVVKNFVLLRTFLYMAPDSDAIMRENFETYYKSMGLQYYDRPEYCSRKLLDLVDSPSLSFAVANHFAKYLFNINKISEAVKVLRNTVESFKDILSTLDWIDDASRDAIFQKLNNIVVFLGYPDFVENENELDQFYENLRICEWDNYGNAQRIRAFRQAYAFSQYNDPDLWRNSPFEVNAYAIRPSNRIMAPLSLLHSSFFYGDNVIFDYSRFGSIIAHEFVHHFDNTGVGYGLDGTYPSSLLTGQTNETFQEKVGCFREQYSKYYVSEIDTNLDGSATLDENIADNCGLKHSYLAFIKQINNQLHKSESDKYTPEQQFFISYATTYCGDQSKEYLSDLVNNNSYAPNRFRVIGSISNLKEFSKAFNCPIGAKMNPKNKCVLW